jgi:hypothetical protein
MLTDLDPSNCDAGDVRGTATDEFEIQALVALLREPSNPAVFRGLPLPPKRMHRVPETMSSLFMWLCSLRWTCRLTQECGERHG